MRRARAGISPLSGGEMGLDPPKYDPGTPQGMGPSPPNAFPAQKNGIWGLTLPKCRQLLLGFGVSVWPQISALRCPGEEFTGRWLKKEKKEIKHRLAISELGQAGHLAGWSCQEKGTEEPASFPLQIARPNEIFRASRLRLGELEEPEAGWGQLVLVPSMGTPWYPWWGRPLLSWRGASPRCLVHPWVGKAPRAPVMGLLGASSRRGRHQAAPKVS